MAKYFLPVVLETNWFSDISARHVKQSALQVQTAAGLSFPTAEVERQPPNTLSLQLPPLFYGYWGCSHDEAEAHPEEATWGRGCLALACVISNEILN